MKPFKRRLSLLLVLCLCLSMMPIQVSAVTAGDGTFTWPLPTKYPITSGWYYNSGGYHGASDFAAPIGNPVYAIADGTVYIAQDYQCQGSHYTGYETCSLGSACPSIAAGSTGSYGNFIIIDHGNIDGKRTYSYYAHLSKDSFQVAKGQTVRQGQQIASSGNSGNSKGAHLHVEIRMGGRDKSNRVDPSLYLTKRNVDTTPTGVDLGTNFYAYIINTGHWKHLTNDGNNVSMRSETGAPNQVWYFERQNDLSYKITSLADGNCMEVWNFGTTDGTNVQTYPYNGNTAQLWHISGTSGAYIFQAKCASTVLDVNGNSSEEGTNVQMWTRNGTGAQLFQVWKLNDYDTSAPSSPTVSLSNSSYGMKSGNYLKDSENVTIRWNANNGDTYRIRIKHSADSGYLVDRNVGSDTSFTYAPSQEGKYTVSVCASNEAGSSSWVSRDFYVRGFYGKHWVSDSPAGDTVTDFQSGDRVYFNYKIYDKVTGDLFFTYYNADYPVTLAIIDPNGTTVASKSYARDDNDYISHVCTTPGTYTAKVTFNGSVYTKEFTVNAKSYTITYNANGGTGTPGSQTKQYGVPLTLSSTVPSGKSFTITFNGNGGTVSESSKRVYQKFTGWNTKSDGSGDPYAAGATYSADAGCTLYAQWDSATLGSVTDPVRDGYQFIGWYTSTDTNSDGFPIGRDYLPSSAIQSNITLYAMWSAADRLYYGDVYRDGSVTDLDLVYINRYLLGKQTPDYPMQEFRLRADLDRDGEITDNDAQMISALRLNQITQAELSQAYVSTTVSANPKRSYQFGEALDTSGLEIDILFDTGASYTITDQLLVKGYDPYKTGTQTLTVQYYQFTAAYTVTVTPETYTISYNANGGSGAPDRQTKQHGTALTLSATVPTRFGYTFLGWATGSSATGAGYLPGDRFTANTNTTLYAVWQPAAAIADDVTNASHVASIPFANGYQYYSFTPSFTGRVQLESTGSGDPQVYLYDVKGNQIASNDDAGNGNNFLLTQAVTAGTKYYVKVKYYGSATGSISFTTTRAYEITYHANGGVSAPSSQLKLYDAPLTLSAVRPTRSNYNFVGWATDRSSTNASYQPGSNFTDNTDITLYAVWSPMNCVLTFDANGGAGVPSPQNSPYGELLTVSSTIPTRFGYTFQGWDTSANASSATCFPGGSLTLGGNTTLYAVWKNAETIDSYVSNRDYDVTIPFANGSVFYVFTPAPKRFQFECRGDGDTQIYLYDAEGTLLASDDDSGDNLNFLLNYDFVSGNTYYVKVQYYGSGSGNFVFNLARAYDITYDANGGTDAPSAQVKTHGVEMTLSTDVPSRSGYSFLGWATKSAATSASYQPGDKYSANSKLSLYAVWYPNCDNDHSYGYKVTKAPTTSASGTLTGTCSRCSATTSVTLPKLNTTDYSYQVTKSATCTAAGTGRYTWKNTTYGSFYFDVSIAATGHTYTSKITAPTCTQKGYTTHTCSGCGHSYADTYVNALGHDLGKWTVVTAATCTKAGTERRDCTRCDHYETRNISATGHTYQPHVTAPTCTESGYTQYICTACGNSYTSDYTDATGHDYKAVVTSATCTKQGYTTYTCHCGDRYVSDYTNVLGHDMGDWVTVTEASCTENGQQIQKCSRCDHRKTRTTEALGHAWDAGIVTIEPTEDTEGEMTYTCGRCRLTRTESIPTRDHEHDYDSIRTAATCTEKGYTTHTCSSCGHSYVDTYVNALGHDMGKWSTVVAASCNDEGLEMRNCSRCDYSETREIAARGHRFTNYVSDHNATCTRDGTKTAVCDYCDASDTIADVGSAYGHNFSNWTVLKEPTATTAGKEARHCYRCGLVETRIIASIGNPFTDVPTGSFYYEPVMWAVANGITNGTSATTFGPNDLCMRAHVVTFLYRAAGSPRITSNKNPFSDVKTGDFFYKPVLWAVEKGITNGVSATAFGAYDICNRAAVVTFLWRAAGCPEPNSTNHPFTDVKTTDFFYKPVLWAAENGITSGIDATHFGPGSPCNRAQVVTFLYRAYN